MTEEELKIARERLEKEQAELLNQVESLTVVANTQREAWNKLIARMDRRIKQFDWFFVGASIFLIAIEILQLVMALKTCAPWPLVVAHALMICWWGYMGFTAFKKT